MGRCSRWAVSSEWTWFRDLASLGWEGQPQFMGCYFIYIWHLSVGCCGSRPEGLHRLLLSSVFRQLKAFPKSSELHPMATPSCKGECESKYLARHIAMPNTPGRVLSARKEENGHWVGAHSACRNRWLWQPNGGYFPRPRPWQGDL